MTLEDTLLSEISQVYKGKYCMFSLNMDTDFLEVETSTAVSRVREMEQEEGSQMQAHGRRGRRIFNAYNSMGCQGEQ